MLRLLGTTRVRVLLREEQRDGYGPAMPLTDLADVEAFFASLGGGDAMYGWDYIDRPGRLDDWPAEPSLTIDIRPGPASHSLFWFTECWTRGDGTRYCIEGAVDFDSLQIIRADGVPEPVEEFIAAGRRWWDALFGLGGRPPRIQVTTENAPSWRPGRTGATLIGDGRQVTGSF
ncbi:hypothetical protein [Paractinoplanes deccanensis]|uniref:hypothetical protein n=1 Tax=Paractinoplanes deccanensis TaxID=113561 RepID=UPI001942AAB9|nr:hypothetical protein [Actinoplanes deccanensis]